ncbi:hypothetical protein ACPA9J_00405 [Pseudomonas aeruginosa]
MAEHQQAMVADVSAAEAELRVDRRSACRRGACRSVRPGPGRQVAGVVEEARITAADRGTQGAQGRRPL